MWISIRQLPKVDFDTAGRSVSAYHVHSQSIGGERVFTELVGTFHLRLLDNALEIRSYLAADLGDLQDKLPRILKTMAERDEECGDRLRLGDVSLQPSDNRAELDVHFQYQRWYCYKDKKYV